MAVDFALDAHTVIWYLEGNPRLGSQAKIAMDAPHNEFALPIIALAEAAYIVHRGRTEIPSVDELFLLVEADGRIQIVPLVYDMVKEASRLAAIPEMHDRLIVATVRYLQTHGYSPVLLTRDETIVTSGLVPTLW